MYNGNKPRIFAPETEKNAFVNVENECVNV